MPDPAFKPSDVHLLRQFVNTFQHAEAEACAVLLVRTLVQNGDAWGPVTMQAAVAVAEADVAAKTRPLYEIFTCPVGQPDPFDLVKRGFARWVDKSGGPIEFTEAGFEGLRKWVRPAEAVG